jgi:hypothetical protein
MMFAARKAVGRVPPTALLFVALAQRSRASFLLRVASSQSNQCKIRKTKLAINAMAVTPATESTNACAATW